MNWKDTFPKENRYFETENGILYCGDCLKIMKGIPKNVIDLVVTSPPYNKMWWSQNKNTHNAFSKKGHIFARNTDYGVYHDNLPPKEYNKWQNNCLLEMRKIIKEEGSIFYNHIDVLNNKLTIHPSFVYNHPIKQIIVWNRKSTPKLDKHYFLPVNEWIFWIKKNKNSKTKFNRKKGVYIKNIWDISPKKNDGKHPAPMVEEIPYNCILTTTEEHDIVLDPFCGSGTTLKVAEQLNRKWIGIELNEEYCEIAKKRIMSVTKQKKLNNY